MSTFLKVNVLGSNVLLDTTKILTEDIYIKNTKSYFFFFLTKSYFVIKHKRNFKLSIIDNNTLNILFKDTLQVNILVDSKYEKLDILIHFKIELSVLEVDNIGITKYSITTFTDNNGYLTEETKYISECNDDKQHYHSLKVAEQMFKIFESKHKSLLNNSTEILY